MGKKEIRVSKKRIFLNGAKIRGIQDVGAPFKEKTDYQWKIERNLFESVQNPKSWKFPTKKRCFRSKAEANFLADAIVSFAGGAEVEKTNSKYCVTSKGYYHYIGA